MKKLLILAVGVLVLSLCVIISTPLPQPSVAHNSDADKGALTVMITNQAGNSGGTGSVLDSGLVTRVLTNSHVCEVVKAGGWVVTDSGTKYPVYSYRQSKKHDLCIIHIMSNLHLRNSLALEAPYIYDSATVSGHPALFPTIITKGHFGAKMIVNILVGIKQCTEQDMQGPDMLACLLLGGLPIIKTYEAQIVSATIMPGSSGSAVYDGSGSIAGVVFAGQGQLSYGLIVPYEHVYRFVTKEYDTLEDQFPSETNAPPKSPRAAKEACKKFPLIKRICDKINKSIEVL